MKLESAAVPFPFGTTISHRPYRFYVVKGNRTMKVTDPACGIGKVRQSIDAAVRQRAHRLA